MSYVRFAWDGSDVYVYDSCTGGIECCGCFFGQPFNCGTPEEMIAHLGTHRRAGHFVPEYAITGLWNAIEGAVKPRKPQPAGLEASGLMMSIARLQIKLDEVRKIEKAEDEKECELNSGSHSEKSKKSHGGSKGSGRSRRQSKKHGPGTP